MNDRELRARVAKHHKLESVGYVPRGAKRTLPTLPSLTPVRLSPTWTRSMSDSSSRRGTVAR
jgi:hypothetical protein